MAAGCRRPQSPELPRELKLFFLVRSRWLKSVAQARAGSSRRNWSRGRSGESGLQKAERSVRKKRQTRLFSGPEINTGQMDAPSLWVGCCPATCVADDEGSTLLSRLGVEA